MVGLPPPSEWREGDDRLLAVGRESLKAVVAYLGGQKLPGNPKPGTVLKTILNRVKALDPGDVRVLLPIFLDDLLSLEAVRQVQGHFDARTPVWTTVYDHAMMLLKDPDGAAEAVMVKLSALVDTLPALSPEQDRIAQERAAARGPRGRAEQPHAVASVSFSGNRGGDGSTGGVGGSGVAVSMGVDAAKLTADVTQSVLGAVNDALAGVVRTVEQLSVKVQQQGAVANGRFERLVALAGMVPDQAGTKDKHVVAALEAMLRRGYNSVVALELEHGDDERVQAVKSTMEMLAAEYVFRSLAAQKGFEAVSMFDQAAFAAADEDQRREMVAQVKRKPMGKKGGKRGAAMGTGSWQNGSGPGPSTPGWQSPIVAPVGPGHYSGTLPPWQSAAHVQPPALPYWSPNGYQAAREATAFQAGPTPTQWQVQGCRGCGQAGHWARDCPNRFCFKCGTRGFTVNTCPKCSGARAGSPGQ